LTFLVKEFDNLVLHNFVQIILVFLILFIVALIDIFIIIFLITIFELKKEKNYCISKKIRIFDFFILNNDNTIFTKKSKRTQ